MTDNAAIHPGATPGDPRVDAALASLDRLDSIDLPAQLDVFTELHAALASILDAPDDDDTVVARQVDDDTVVARQVDDDTVVARQVDDDTVVARQVDDDTVAARQVDDDTVAAPRVDDTVARSPVS